jgi:hydrogenase maturation protein HypF
VGRLFDALAALVGVRATVTYEAQAAVDLEALACTVPRAEAPVFDVDVDAAGPDGLVVVDPGPLVAAVVAGRAQAVPAALLAAGIHEGLGRAAARAATTAARAHGLRTVALTGGVFQNARLAAVVEEALVAAGLEVLTHRRVPPNDAGISIGQAASAAARA